MKIGVASFFRLNYGAILQAYALQQVVKAFGHSAEVIDFEVAPGRGNTMLMSWRSGKGVVINLFTLLRYRALRNRLRRISDFHRQHLKISRNSYHSVGELKYCQSEYDAFICGSDQIWHPNKIDFLGEFYFLAFADQTKKKIAYAPSFGVSQITDIQRMKIAPWLKGITHLSTREQTGQKIIAESIGEPPPVVLDPTLLLKSAQWDIIKSPPMVNAPYILVYSTSQRGLFPKLLRHVKKVTGLPVVVISLHALNLIPEADRVVYDAGPCEFVSLFANATCVCTNSFHGTAFSIIYRKPFWGTPHNATNSRVHDLLRRTGLEERQVGTPDDFPKSPLGIDYSRPGELLNEARAHSLGFLKESLRE